MLGHEVQTQRHWHEINVDVMHQLDHCPAPVGERMLLPDVGGARLGLHRARRPIASFPDEQDAYWLKWTKPLLLLFAAGLPALGAALTGIRVQGGFDDSKDARNT